jgi:putative membrane-bound dehydrogenase-like protein
LIEKTGPCPTLTRYTPIENWTTFPIEPAPTSVYPVGTVQHPLNPFQSINCAQVPAGLKAQIVASELTPGPSFAMAYLMHFTFDERGRAWVVDTRDYPYQHMNAAGDSTGPSNISTNRLTGGQSRILILEDVNGDGAMDNFKIFYTGLAIPTSIEVVKNGVIVTVPPFVYYIPKNGTNPDTAGTVQTLITGMGGTGGYDSHGQINSLTRGLDNWIYGHYGYNGNVTATLLTNAGVSFGSGNIWRFKAVVIGSDTNVFQVYGTGGPSNAHGLGQMEDGQWFKSGATGSSHNNHQARPGVAVVNIETNNRYYPLTQDRYLWEGSTSEVTNGFNSTSTSAASGSDFYQARLLPQKYWNRFSFVCEGASKLCNQDSLIENGSTWSALRMPGPIRSNIFASTDAWTAPLKVRTGPDGGLWVNDWYNYLFLHNPASPSTMSAWNNGLRKKTRTRLYRIIPAEGNTDPVLNLSNAANSQLVATLWNTNFVWRLQAQRLLIERGYSEEIGNLLDSVLTRHRTVDAVGIDGPVLHALWTLNGLKRFDIDSARWNPKLRDLLLHPAWTVRRNVTLAMPATAASAQSIGDMCAVNDAHAHVRLQALQNLTRMPVATNGPIESMSGMRSDTHITAAYTAAGTSKVTSVTVTGTTRPTTCPAYAATSADSAGYPGVVVSIAHNRSVQQRHNLNFTVLSNGFELGTPHAQLGSGELAVQDLRGRVVFRSTYNASTGLWSQKTAKDLAHPVYFYSFRGVNGDTFNGRVSLTSAF